MIDDASPSTKQPTHPPTQPNPPTQPTQPTLQPCVVVIDSASIYFPRVDVDNEAANAQAAVLVKHMCSVGADEAVVTVVVATDRRSVHQRVVANTLDQIEVELPSSQERADILVRLLSLATLFDRPPAPSRRLAPASLPCTIPKCRRLCC